MDGLTEMKAVDQIDEETDGLGKICSIQVEKGTDDEKGNVFRKVCLDFDPLQDSNELLTCETEDCLLEPTNESIDIEVEADPDQMDVEKTLNNNEDHDCDCCDDCASSESDDERELHICYNNYYEEEWPEKLKCLEEEQEQLNSSLIALTSHFAQVQLRLKQIVDASADEKEKLLKDLEEFAFRGIPDLRKAGLELEVYQENDSSIDDVNDGQLKVCKLELQRQRQKELMIKLKEQLEDLEKYAYETGELNAIPSSMLLERQTVIIEQLKGKLSLNLDEMDKLSPEDLRLQVDKAIRDLVNPVIMKEQLVNQLKTQVTDLERFIEFLQDGSTPCHSNSKKCTCNCPLHGNSQKGLQKYDENVAAEQKRKQRQKSRKGRNQKLSDDENENRDTAIRLIRRMLTLLQMFTFTQFGCNRSTQRFERNMLKKTTKGNHWGDLRARLEVAVDHILEFNKEKSCNDSDYTSDSDEAQVSHCNEKMTLIVRKELCVSLRDLLQHGLIDALSSTSSQSLLPSSLFVWGCFSTRASQISNNNGLTVWDLFLRYYQLKNGSLYNASPARRLSQSFNLQIVGGSAITPKQTLLSVIDEIIETHTRLKRSPDSHFKAFVCQALNEHKLVTWLRLLVKSRTIVENFYEPWSYVVSTGFDDALRTLERLNSIKFNLPIDLAVRQLQNINDAF